MAVKAIKGPKFVCPQCKAALDDYAPTCIECNCDVLSNDPRPPELLAKSINRNDRSVFFIVSPLKLVVMSIVTFGFYELFWFYKNWHYVQEHTKKHEFPLINSIFRMFTYYYLMVEIRRAGAAQQKSCPFSSALLAVCYAALIACGALSKFWPVIALVGLLSPLALVPVQKYVNDMLNSESSKAINSRFGVANWIAIVIGGALALIGIIGILTGRD
jgi:hypothetical protein